jgi:hypothetical protein
MPRKSPYRITLTRHEENELLNRSSKYTLPYFMVLRAKMILLAAQGLDNDQIAAKLDTRREVVCMWRKRFFEQRLDGLEERSRRGRPRAFPPQNWSFKLKPSPVSCRLNMEFPFLAGALKTFSIMSGNPAW